MSLSGLPDEIIEHIIAQSYQIKLASVFNLLDVPESPFLISYARRTPVYPLSMVSKRIRTICIPTLFSRVLVNEGISETVLSGNLQQFLKLNVDHLHLIKQVDFSDVHFDVVKPLLKAFFNLELAVFSPWHLQSTEYLESIREHPALRKQVVDPIESHRMRPPHASGEGTLFRMYRTLDFMGDLDSAEFLQLGAAQLAEAYLTKRFGAKDQTLTFHSDLTLPGLYRLHLEEAWEYWAYLEDEDVIEKFSSFVSKHPDLRIITFHPAFSDEENEDIPLPFPCVHEAFAKLQGKLEIDQTDACIMRMGVYRDEAGAWFMGEAAMVANATRSDSEDALGYPLSLLMEAMPRLLELHLTVFVDRWNDGQHFRLEEITDFIFKQYSGSYQPLQLAIHLQAPHLFTPQEPITSSSSEMRKKVIDLATELARGVPSLSLLELEETEASSKCIVRVVRQEGGRCRIVPQIKVDGYVNEEPDASAHEYGRDKFIDLTEEEWNRWPAREE